MTRQRHGCARLPEYAAWAVMRDRCSNRRNHKYPRYGGRGIRVCGRWAFFSNFIADMGPRPGPGYSVDRIDNNGHYEPSNCRWATAVEQASNTSRAIIVERNGTSLTLTEWCRRLRLNYATVRYRMVRRAMTFEQAATAERWSRRHAG